MSQFSFEYLKLQTIQFIIGYEIIQRCQWEQNNSLRAINYFRNVGGFWRGAFQSDFHLLYKFKKSKFWNKTSLKLFYLTLNSLTRDLITLEILALSSWDSLISFSRSILLPTTMTGVFSEIFLIFGSQKVCNLSIVSRRAIS